MYKSIHLNKICLWSFLVISLILFLSPVSNTISSLINDKVSHAFAYGTLFFLAAKSYKDKYSSLYIGLLVFLLGFTVEIVQSMTGYRSGEFDDILANVFGIGLVGILRIV